MKKTLFALGAAAAVVLFLAGVGIAYGPGGGGCPFHQNAASSGQAADDVKAPSEADLAKWQAERDAFHAATKELVRSMQDKQEELDKVISADKPDLAKAKSIQKDISGIAAQLDQKHIEHIVKMRELGFAVPGFGPGPGNGPGYGCGRGPGYGPGSGCGRGPGYSAGCGGGQGYGPGNGRGYGCGR